MLRRPICIAPCTRSPRRLACCVLAALPGLLLSAGASRLPAAVPFIATATVSRPAWIPPVRTLPAEDMLPAPVAATFFGEEPSDSNPAGCTVLPSPERRFARPGSLPDTAWQIDAESGEPGRFRNGIAEYQLLTANSAGVPDRPVTGPARWHSTEEPIVFRGASPEDFLVPVASRNSRGGGQLLRIRGEYIDDGGDLRRLRGNVQLTLAKRLAFDGSFSHWTRPPAGIDDLWTGDANLVYVFGLGTPVRLRMGGGANFLESSTESELGFNSTWGIDISIRRPWIVSGELDLGTLGDESLFHGRASLNALLGFLEIYAGYDWFEAGSLQMEGPVAGAGLWF